MRLRVLMGLLISGLILASQPSPAWARRTGIHDAADAPRYTTKAVGMLGRGVLNIATCFVDILTQTVLWSRNDAPVVGTLKGLAYGTSCGLLRLGSGAVDVVTFWVPGFNGAPVAASYDNCLATDDRI